MGAHSLVRLLFKFENIMYAEIFLVKQYIYLLGFLGVCILTKPILS